MTTDQDLRPEEFGQAAAAVIAEAQTRPAREAGEVLAGGGLCGVGAAEEVGGLGLGVEYALPIIAEAGKLQLQWPLLETMVIAKALGSSPLAAQLCSGERAATWALQGSLSAGVAGHARHAELADWVLVAKGNGEAALVDIKSVRLTLDAALDPDFPQSWIHLEGAKIVAELDAEAFSELQREGDILIAGLVNGAAESALLSTSTYLSGRVQFGRPLTAKQAVRHQLAKMRLLQEASSASIQRVLRQNEQGDSRDTRPALTNALNSAAFVLEKSIHLHGGMGFTWEVPLHYSLREIRKFDAAFGSGQLAQQVGADFIESV
ncbi:acyl-CoA dehydrogenase family protein [Ottowia thiooxydans]|uniref:acyl-CoA dehydrogenase family protein n=1 Tax=Ottowia thiooxydans TaxID=219182 RepID=UPI000401D4BC|nr:acyl-CoA dehydrogenase family protein [Ottowia thiooxydans]